MATTANSGSLGAFHTSDTYLRMPGGVSVALWPITLVLYATLMPRELRIEIGTFAIYADRIGLLIALPYVIRKVLQGAIRFVLPDFLVLITGLWMTVAMMYHYGFGVGLERGGSQALDATAGYYLARISFRSLNDVRKVLIMFSPGVFVAGFSVMLESITHREIVSPIAEALFGKLPYFVGGEVVGARDYRDLFRLGLMRAKGPFSHSILAGLYLATMSSLFLLSGIRGWPKVLGIIASLFAFFSLSSAAVLGLLLGYGLSFYEWLQDQVRELSWRLFVTLGLIVFGALNIVSDSGFVGVVSRYLTFNPATAYYRQLIWRYGTQSVEAHPVFGIGFAGYARPRWMVSGSVDAHWLLVAIRFGLLPSVLILTSVILALVALGRASANAPRTDRKFYRGIAIALFVMGLSMFTVTLWGGVLTWFNLLLGGCVACAQRNYKKIEVKF